MADSDTPFHYGAAQLSALRASLSEPRFATYLEKAGHDPAYALQLYLYNARLAKAFLFPLHIVEVTLRNAMDGMLVNHYGQTWHQHDPFRTGVLTDQGLSTLDKAIQRAGNGAARGAVVAELTFDFWSNLLRPEYHALWRTSLSAVFPNVTKGTGRHEIQVSAKKINHLRNRVAHHEPLLDVNVPDVSSRMYELLALVCKETSAWVRHHATLSRVVRTRPRKDGTASQLAARLAPDFLRVTAATTLIEVVEGLDRKCQTAVCVDDDDQPVAAFTALDVTRFVAIDARRNGNLFAADERTVGELLAEIDAAARWAGLPMDVPLTDGIAVLKGKGTDVLVGTNPASGAPVGTIQRAQRRY